MTLAPVPTAHLAAVWPAVAPWLAGVCARPDSDLTRDALYRLCARQEALLIVVHDEAAPVAAGVSQVRRHDDGALSCWILAMGGIGARLWRHTLAQIEAGARAKGCSAVEFVGRRGWARLLPDYRAEPCERGTHYEKRLVH